MFYFLSIEFFYFFPDIFYGKNFYFYNNSRDLLLQ